MMSHLGGPTFGRYVLAWRCRVLISGTIAALFDAAGIFSCFFYVGRVWMAVGATLAGLATVMAKRHTVPAP